MGPSSRWSRFWGLCASRLLRSHLGQVPCRSADGRHDHDYERTKPPQGPLDKPTVAADFKSGTEYIVCGGAGADPYGAKTSDFTAFSRDATSGSPIGLYTLIHASTASLR